MSSQAIKLPLAKKGTEEEEPPMNNTPNDEETENPEGDRWDGLGNRRPNK